MPVPTGLEDTFGPWPNGDAANPGDDTDPTTPQIETSGIPFWVGNEVLWDTITIAGVQLPGLCDVDAEVKRKLDKKNAKGVDGMTITDDGEDEAPVDIQLTIATPQDWARFLSIVPLINPKRAGKMTAVTVDHPALAVYGITKIYIEAISTPKRGSVPQTRTVRIKATEWRPAPKTTATKSNTTATATQGTQADIVWAVGPNGEVYATGTMSEGYVPPSSTPGQGAGQNYGSGAGAGGVTGVIPDTEP